MKRLSLAPLILALFLSQVPSAFAEGEDAGDYMYFESLKESRQAIVNEAIAGNGYICKYGTMTSTQMRKKPPTKYSGKEGDLWIQILDDDSNSGFFWNKNSWVNGGTAWDKYFAQWQQKMRAASAVAMGNVCVASENKTIDSNNAKPTSNYMGKKYDLWVMSDKKYGYETSRFIWDGSQWVPSSMNEYFELAGISYVASRDAQNTKIGEVCTYGVNRDTTSNFYTTPPKDYKGAVADLWVVKNKLTNHQIARYYWNGKAWIKDTSKEASSLKKKNDGAQNTANLDAAQHCVAGKMKTTIAALTAPNVQNYQGQIGDTWIDYEVENTEYYYWNGTNWIGRGGIFKL